jgi:hypothetical protein
VDWPCLDSSFRPARGPQCRSLFFARVLSAPPGPAAAVLLGSCVRSDFCFSCSRVRRSAVVLLSGYCSAWQGESPELIRRSLALFLCSLPAASIVRELCCRSGIRPRPSFFCSRSGYAVRPRSSSAFGSANLASFRLPFFDFVVPIL